MSDLLFLPEKRVRTTFAQPSSKTDPAPLSPAFGSAVAPVAKWWISSAR